MDFSHIIHIIAIIALPLLFAITLHEAAHGWVANKLGDNTALVQGRVTLNPAKHIDLFGTIILPILMLVLSNFKFAFGWAKPVPVNWQQLNNPRRDMAFVAIAGPLANLFMAFIWAVIAKLSIATIGSTSNEFTQSIANFFAKAGLFGILINCILMLLNLIPVPPLDGSRVVSSLLPPKMAEKYNMLEPYGIWILIALLIFGVLGKILHGPLIYLVNAIRSLFGI